jgi:hypothetical protein
MARDFFLLRGVQTASGSRPASYPMATEGHLPERPESEADRSNTSSAEVKSGGAIPPLPIRLHGIMLK